MNSKEIDLFKVIEKVHAGDVKKLQDAGIYTCNRMKSLTEIEGLSEAKAVCWPIQFVISSTKCALSRPDHIVRIAERFGIDAGAVLDKVDFTGRELAESQQKLSQMIVEIPKEFNIAVYMTNSALEVVAEVIANPGKGVFDNADARIGRQIGIAGTVGGTSGIDWSGAGRGGGAGTGGDVAGPGGGVASGAGTGGGVGVGAGGDGCGGGGGGVDNDDCWG